MKKKKCRVYRKLPIAQTGVKKNWVDPGAGQLPWYMRPEEAGMLSNNWAQPSVVNPPSDYIAPPAPPAKPTITNIKATNNVQQGEGFRINKPMNIGEQGLSIPASWKQPNQTQDSKKDPVNEDITSNFINWLHGSKKEAIDKKMLEEDMAAIDNGDYQIGGNIYAHGGEEKEPIDFREISGYRSGDYGQKRNRNLGYFQAATANMPGIMENIAMTASGLNAMKGSHGRPNFNFRPNISENVDTDVATNLPTQSIFSDTERPLITEEINEAFPEQGVPVTPNPPQPSWYTDTEKLYGQGTFNPSSINSSIIEPSTIDSTTTIPPVINSPVVDPYFNTDWDEFDSYNTKRDNNIFARNNRGNNRGNHSKGILGETTSPRLQKKLMKQLELEGYKYGGYLPEYQTTGQVSYPGYGVLDPEELLRQQQQQESVNEDDYTTASDYYADQNAKNIYEKYTPKPFQDPIGAASGKYDNEVSESTAQETVLNPGEGVLKPNTMSFNSFGKKPGGFGSFNKSNAEHQNQAQGAITTMKGITGIASYADKRKADERIKSRMSDIFQFVDTAGADRGNYLADTPGIGGNFRVDELTREGYNVPTGESGGDIPYMQPGDMPNENNYMTETDYLTASNNAHNLAIGNDLRTYNPIPSALPEEDLYNNYITQEDAIANQKAQAYTNMLATGADFRKHGGSTAPMNSIINTEGNKRTEAVEYNIDDEVELSEAQIGALINQGYQLEYLD